MNGGVPVVPYTSAGQRILIPQCLGAGYINTRGGRLRNATNHYRAGDKRVGPHDCGPRSRADSRLTRGDRKALQYA
jgi:hypothetical protein